MAKKELSEKQKEVLEKNKFTPSIARELGAKGGKAKKANEPKRKALEMIKNEIIEKSFSLVYEMLNKEEVTSQEIRDIFKHAVDMSGFKQDTQNLNIDPPVINISDLKI